LKIKEIYDFVVEKGMDKDPRKREGVEELLSREKKKFEEMKEKDKEEY